MLTQLLRKKLDPDAESWVQSGLERANERLVGSADALPHDSARIDSVAGRQQRQARERLWTDASARARELAAKMPWGANYTMAERKGEGGIRKVETGLRRDLAGEESEGEDDDDDDDDEENEDDDVEGEDDEGHGAGDAEKMDVDAKKTETQPAVPKGPMLPLEDVLRFMSTGVLVPRRPGGVPGPGPGPRQGGMIVR